MINITISGNIGWETPNQIMGIYWYNDEKRDGSQETGNVQLFCKREWFVTHFGLD